ncbi:flagella biosynthesis regulator Flk [Affinibrenneria salicis]|uniref:Flagella biosynthesis regulator Flk n=1 Tax=Affinibrenneria salicis TaxID=2590031 RepID=A0A5J5FV27_9GAMM|nr:flagella biosynthesis regulator Flk [Affinibrenneria salicis]KAA8996969.1 flagella biosynthesis regulator Flk [Affinibrenneria salicis]
MQPVTGPVPPLTGDRTAGAGGSPPLKPHDPDQPLTPAQRTTLERLIVKILTISTLKSAEIWAGLRHDLGLPNNGELASRHFQPAEQLLQARLSQVQESHGRQQLLQQLTDLLPQGNNRQAVSDFIRQNFGHTVLSSLSSTQLQQVVSQLQNGQIAIPQPQQAAPALADRPLAAAEHSNLNQLVTKLAALNGEPPTRIWQALLEMQGLTSGEPLPARNFQMLSQYLQTQTSLLQLNTPPTLTTLHGALRQPADGQEQQLLLDYSQSRFNAGPNTPLTPAQIGELVTILFVDRLQRMKSQNHIETTLEPQPLLNPLIAALPLNWQPLFNKPRFLLIVGVCVLALLLWLLF